MTSVTSAFIKVFESSGFECELIETEKEDQVRIPITGDTFGPRLMVVRFPHEGDYLAVFLADLLEIPKGKAANALKVANELAPLLPPGQVLGGQEEPLSVGHGQHLRGRRDRGGYRRQSRRPAGGLLQPDVPGV